MKPIRIVLHVAVLLIKPSTWKFQLAGIYREFHP
jgi:hypothetical protein